MEINFIITCFDRESFWPEAKQTINSYKKIKPNIILCYNGSDEEFKKEAQVFLKNKGHQLGEISLISEGARYAKNNYECKKFVKLSIDSWIIDEDVIISTFQNLSRNKSCYAGNFWSTTNELSTDIFFVDEESGELFNNFVISEQEAQQVKDGLIIAENIMIRAVFNTNKNIVLIREREPVHPNNRFKCEELLCTMEHDLNENINNKNLFKKIKTIKNLLNLHQLKSDKINSYGKLNPESFHLNPCGYDGAYSLSEKCLKKSKHVYSYGVGIYDVDFKFYNEISNLQNKVYMYDGQVNFKSNDKNLIFKKENVDSEKIIKHINENKHTGETEMLLKIDIEGAEYETISNSIKKIKKHFNQIAIEVHGLLDTENDFENKVSMFEKLNKDYYLIHLRANNYGKSIKNFADSLELTYVRKDQFEEKEIDQIDIIYPSDPNHHANCYLIPEINLNWINPNCNAVYKNYIEKCKTYSDIQLSRSLV
jgi:FkbM family methyltransferase